MSIHTAPGNSAKLIRLFSNMSRVDYEESMGENTEWANNKLWIINIRQL